MSAVGADGRASPEAAAQEDAELQRRDGWRDAEGRAAHGAEVISPVLLLLSEQI